jgi:hypothetical protein
VAFKRSESSRKHQSCMTLLCIIRLARFQNPRVEPQQLSGNLHAAGTKIWSLRISDFRDSCKSLVKVRTIHLHTVPKRPPSNTIHLHVLYKNNIPKSQPSQHTQITLSLYVIFFLFICLTRKL